jgi:hypothetical protein
MASKPGFEERLKAIEARNRKVETDKGWELSYTRRGLLTFFTYVSVGAYLQAIDVPEPWLNAIVPSIAFMLSTLTLPLAKKIWISNIANKSSK